MVRAVAVAFGSSDLAQEVTDEAFARAWTDWDRVRSMASPTGWVYRVAANLMRSRLRRVQLERRFARRVPASVLAMPPPATPNEALWAAVDALRPRARTAIALRYVADLSEMEVATAMGISRGTVASTLSAARRRLAEVLAADQEGIFK